MTRERLPNQRASISSDSSTQVQTKQLRAVRRAAMQAREEARLAYQFAPCSYTYTALAQIELMLVRLAEIES